MKKIFAIIFLVLVSLFLTIKAHAQPLYEDGTEHERLIVKFKSISPSFYRKNLVQNVGGMLIDELTLPDTLVVSLPKGKLFDALSRLEKNFLVEYAEEDYVAKALEVPNDPMFPNQWGLTKVKAPEAWDATHGASTTDLAILDTGIDGSHPDIKDKISASVDCTLSSSCPKVSPTDANGHGTHIAGIASAVTGNGIGVAGVSWDGKLVSVKVLDNNGSGYYSWAANGIIWAADNGAEVINLSFGARYSSYTLSRAINYAWDKGVVIVAAAGNNNSSSALYPAYYSNVIAVAATDDADNKANFSNYGSWVDLAAPGVSVLSTYQGSFEYLSGTSMAAPFVSGVAALVFGQNPNLTNSLVREKVEKTADKISGTGTYFKFGRVNACAAVDCNGFRPTPTLTPTPTPSPTPSLVMTPTLTPTPSLTLVPTLTSTPTPTVQVSPTPTPIPQKPWWCRYFPSSPNCQ